ncbi:hypothetical protein FRC12_013654 [Ceratobasidium sp. 428]|nr:hypothetical protein FRC12_013654 [Ceratobasidium sp. 428]
MYDALTCSARYQAARPPVRRVGCIKHTRGSVLAELDDWAGNPKSPNIYWMNGMAGTGKTTIAYSLCSTLEANGQLAANFFCSRASPICRHAAWIVPDIAYQLAALFPAFYNPFAQVLQNQPNVFGCPVVDQVEKLLKQPLLLVNGKIPKNQVIVIDAIDECTDRADARAILAALMTFAMESHIKLFISCRPDFYVLKGVIGDSRFQVLHLHEIEESLVQADMVTYLRAELRPVSMPVEDIKRLAKLSGRLFLYARVAVVYILSRYRRRSTTLDIVMSNNDAFLDIDGLYKSTLYYILNDPDSEIDRHTARWILFALHTVVCSGKPIAMETLASLLGTRPIGAVEAMLRPLESLVHIPRDKGPIQLLHSSFADFILSQERAKLFFCNPERHGELLARIAGRSVSTVDPISREMPMSEIITQLSKHGCQDITEQLDEDTSSRHPVSDGGFGDVYKARLRDGTEVAIKVARVYIDAIGEAKALKVRALCAYDLFNYY